MTRFRTILIVAASFLAATVAGLAFWVSFEAISAYAVQIGALPHSLRYCAPLLVDSFTMLGTAFLLWLALSGTPLRQTWDAWYAWTLIIVATAGSAALNAAHVAPASPTEARWVAGAVPVTLLASVHLLVLLLLRLLAWTPPSEPIRESAQGVGEREQGGAPVAPPAPAPRSRAATTEAGSTPHPPRPRPVAAPKNAPDRDTQRARVIQEHAGESDRKIIAAVRAAGVGCSSERLAEDIRRVKAAGNGSTRPQDFDPEQVQA